MKFDRCKICIRAITPEDAPKLVAGLHDLSEKTRYARFFFFKRAFASDELSALTHCDGVSHGALVAELTDVSNRPLIAVARWIRDAIDPTMAEVAFLTRDDWQRQGIGTALVKKVVKDAFKNGITRFRAQILWENLAAIKVLAAVGRCERSQTITAGVAECIYALCPE